MKTKINKRDLLIVLAIFAFGLFVGWLFFHGGAEDKAYDIATVEQQETIYTCSMHPQIKQNHPGSCPICGMDLVPMVSETSDAENLDPNEIALSQSALALADVQTSIVKKGVPKKDIQLQGKVKADERNISQLTARFGGRIEKLYINFTGQKVRKGEKLASIYSPELISAQKELLEAVRFKESNPSFYKSARKKLKLWELSDAQVNAIEEGGEPKTDFDILAPISGTVTRRDIALGDYVKVGNPLFELVDLSRVWVMFDAYESDLPWIKVGDKISFMIQSVPGKQYEGKVRFIDPLINPQTRTAQVRVELANPSEKLKPEMFANGTLISNIASNSSELMIPKTAILWTGKRAIVYLKVPEREASFIAKEIELGAEAGNFYVVKDGLAEGDEIAVNGVFKIDAAAQLAGKRSMMNPEGGKVQSAHDHSKMQMDMGDK